MRVLVVYFRNGTRRTAGAEVDALPSVGDILEGFGFREPQVVTGLKTLSELGSGITLVVPEIHCARWAGKLVVRRDPPASSPV